MVQGKTFASHQNLVRSMNEIEDIAKEIIPKTKMMK